MRSIADDAKIYRGHDSSLRAGVVRGQAFAPKGKTTVINITGRVHETLTMVSGITNRGRVHWMLFDGTIYAEKFIEFMEGLTKDAKSKVFLILDDLRVHHISQ